MRDKITVLISDDNDEFVTTLSNYLENDGEMQVIGRAKDGEEVLDMINALRPDVVLLDVIMPHLDGLRSIREAKCNGTRQSTNMYYAICCWTR